MVNLLHTFGTFGFLTNFQNFSRVFRPTDDLFRVMIDIITRVFNDSGATRADLIYPTIYQRSRIKNRFKHLSWRFFANIVNDVSLFSVNIHLLSVFHWQFLITYTFSVSLKFGACYITDQWGQVQSKECYFMCTYIFLAFFCCVFIKKLVFLACLFLFFLLSKIFFRFLKFCLYKRNN